MHYFYVIEIMFNSFKSTAGHVDETPVSRDMVQVYGSSLWFKSMVQVYGSSLWLRCSSVPICCVLRHFIRIASADSAD